jgi:hypothetical protein
LEGLIELKEQKTLTKVLRKKLEIKKKKQGLKWKTKHMRNYNWMTKLKRIKTSINKKGTKQEIHRMKNEIEK